MRLIPARLALAVLAAACVRGPETAADGAVAMFRVDPAHSGVQAALEGAGYAGLAWVVRTGGPVRSSPVVAGGTAYVGSGDGHVYAIDLATGDVRWRFAADGAVDASPGVARGLVLIQSRRGTLYAIDAATGRRRWRRETGPLAPLPWGGESGDAYTSSAVVAGDRAVFGAGDGSVLALEIESGDVVWRAALDGRVRATPAVQGDLVVVGTQAGTVHALALEDGARRWTFRTVGAGLDSRDFGYDRRLVQSSAAIAGGVAYVGARDGFLWAVDLATGRERWRFDHEISWVNSSPAVDGARVYAGSSDGLFVQAVDARTGAEVWRLPTGLVWASPTVAGGTVFVGDARGVLHAIDAATGAERWSHATGSRIYSSAWVADSLVLFGADDGAVRALRLTAGPPLERAVYWDSAGAALAWVSREDVRDGLVARGYEPLDAGTIAGWMSARAGDGIPSAVVFASDAVPAAVLDGAATSLLRRYMEAGGRVVWLGPPPGIWPKTAEGADFAALDRAAPERLLGLSFAGAIFDREGATPTDEGRRAGIIEAFVLSGWSVDPAGVDVVLARDEDGNAALWVERFGAGAFVQAYALDPSDPARGASLGTVVALAESRLRD